MASGERLFHILADAGAAVAGGEIGFGIATKAPLIIATGVSIGLTGAAIIYRHHYYKNYRDSIEQKFKDLRHKLDSYKDTQDSHK